MFSKFNTYLLGLSIDYNLNTKLTNLNQFIVYFLRNGGLFLPQNTMRKVIMRSSFHNKLKIGINFTIVRGEKSHCIIKRNQDKTF